MKFIVDECLSHVLVRYLAVRGFPDAIHPIHVGLLGARDDQIVARALAEDRIVIMANGRDYKRLAAGMEVHPGVIVVEALEREATWRLIQLALAFIELQSQPADYMVNRVVEVSAASGVTPYLLAQDTH